MIAQFTLTVPEAKRFIARGIREMPSVRRALYGGKVLLKGGTTVSAVSEELGGPTLGIGGRITPGGARAAFDDSAPHCIVMEKGRVILFDRDGLTLEEAVWSMGPRDIAITGASLIDTEGGAAILSGDPSGGCAGRIFAGLAAQGVPTIIACGAEKLGPGRVADAANACGRTRIDLAMGMAVGLLILHGSLITEVQACHLLARVRATLIARGGVFGAEGGSTLAVEGDAEELEKIISAVKEIKGAPLSGDPRSLMDCCPGHGSWATSLSSARGEGPPRSSRF